ncbi:4Fe-4S dicluster domain-containing protein [Pyrobaculum neutrophilum]|uniref:4Fe-4S ferredoxin iron-sulfur binding domain protein n=1 Tax=Pyrobaculum neutrophilum (strain DSM 2338 / JCM 9278 / NBRC 100436 / V24Sta) TaxID=444157 RepID=B1YDX3_PYRNV|nr:4Fe-4S dicluster domain-containing protein [Pyrobaculum neutrophilum]ACB39986.1 4Fe-4S ferredoxin iron-sulfur binding domain protein [Pyrobaculum neutrophilum V24Sta]
MVSIKFPRPEEGYAVLVDLDKCIGCRACQVACKEWNGLSAERTQFQGVLTSPQSLTSKDWKVVFYYEGATRKRLLTPSGEVAFSQVEVAPLPYNCMHCVEAPCARACPVGAIKVSPEGAVVIEKDECIGCGYCQMACPYDVPKRGDDGKFYKCTFCVDRIQNGREPACVEVCPTRVFTFGPAKDVIERARQEEAKGRKVYGLNVDRYVGGSVRWIYVTSERRGFALDSHFADKGKPVAVEEAREVLKPLVTVGGAALAGALAVLGLAAWRRERVQEKKQ